MIKELLSILLNSRTQPSYVLPFANGLTLFESVIFQKKQTTKTYKKILKGKF